MTTPLQAVEAALDAGHAAVDLLTATDPFRPKRRPLAAVLGALGVPKYAEEPRPPSAEALRRAADAIDAFTAALADYADAGADEDIHLLAAELAPLGADVWADRTDPVAAYRRITEVNGILKRHRTRRILGRDIGFDT